MMRTGLAVLVAVACMAGLFGCKKDQPPASSNLPTAGTLPPPPQPGRSNQPATPRPASRAAPQSQAPPAPATGTTPSAPAPAAAANPATGPLSHVETDSGLIIEDLTLGTGAEAKKFDTVKVNYVGTLDTGKEFANSYTSHQPLVANLAGGVIKGWQEGILGMKVGGKRRLIVPPDLGYGAKGSPPAIPPNSMLVFEIELMDIVK
jgi:FKBP-type peptidyl-prolyl cis-trans isomerase